MSAGSKSRLAKAAGAEVAAESRQRGTLQLKMYKAPRLPSTCGRWDVEKWHAAVARRAFACQGAKKPEVPGHFSKFRCGKLGL